MKILAYIYLFDILLKITSPRLNGLTNLIFNLHAKDIHDFSTVDREGMHNSL